MTEMVLKIRVKKTPVSTPMTGFERFVGNQYLITCNGKRIGIYYAKTKYMQLEPIPAWLPMLKNKVAQEIKKTLKMKVECYTVARGLRKEEKS